MFGRRRQSSADTLPRAAYTAALDLAKSETAGELRTALDPESSDDVRHSALLRAVGQTTVIRIFAGALDERAGLGADLQTDLEAALDALFPLLPDLDEEDAS